MTTAEERIKQAFEYWREKEGLMSLDHLKEEVKRIEKDVLQILADFKIIPLEKWCELLKLVQDRPRIESDKIYDGKYLLYTTEELDKKVREFEESFKKIEEKLKELEK